MAVTNSVRVREASNLISIAKETNCQYIHALQRVAQTIEHKIDRESQKRFSSNSHQIALV